MPGTAGTKGKRRRTAAEPTHVECACSVASGSGERKAVGVDPDIKDANLNRLRRIEGQVRGLQKMVAEDRYCADIMTQMSSVQEALRAVGRELMRNHLRHCASAAIRSNDADADAMYDEIVELMYRQGR
jgi:CsoR family transcriptional regulator, copper-sensing transcriptional repressor